MTSADILILARLFLLAGQATLTQLNYSSVLLLMQVIGEKVKERNHSSLKTHYSGFNLLLV